MKIRWKILAGTIAVVLLVGVGAIEGVYRSGLGTLTTLPEPPPTDALSDAVTQLAWLEFEGAGPIVVKPTGPLRYAMGLALDGGRPVNGLPAAGHRIAAFCARHVIAEQHPDGLRPLEFNLAGASLSIWLSRHWSTGQIIACALKGGFYGHGFIGIEAATRGYFGTRPTDLSHSEAAILLVALRGPYFDPVCNPDAVLAEANLLLARLAEESFFGQPLRDPDIAPSSDLGLDSSIQCGR